MVCKKRKRKNVTDKWTCNSWEECVGHAPLPTPGNFEMFEIWQDVTSQIKVSMGGPTGFDLLAVKEVVTRI